MKKILRGIKTFFVEWFWLGTLGTIIQVIAAILAIIMFWRHDKNQQNSKKN